MHHLWTVEKAAALFFLEEFSPFLQKSFVQNFRGLFCWEEVHLGNSYYYIVVGALVVWMKETSSSWAWFFVNGTLQSLPKKRRRRRGKPSCSSELRSRRVCKQRRIRNECLFDHSLCVCEEESNNNNEEKQGWDDEESLYGNEPNKWMEFLYAVHERGSRTY